MIKSNRRSVEQDLDREIRKRLEASGIVVSNEAKKIVGVDSGRLRASITHEVSEDSVRIGTNVEYGKFHHGGTRFQRPNPFLVNGLMDSKGDLQRIWGG